MESLKLSWLGHPLVELKGRAIKLETRKAAALPAYLSLNPGECPREILATMFWQEGSQQKALTNHRRTIFFEFESARVNRGGSGFNHTET